MTIYGGPDIITNGLVLHLDAANSKSYPGSGTSWFDLSGNNNHGTLTNGPSYSSANNGSIVADGSNDYVDVSNNFNLSNMTLLGWIYIDSTIASSWRGIFYTASGPASGGWWIGYNVGTGLACGFGPNYQPRRDSSVQLSYNTWHMIGFTINNTSKITTGYYNNALSFGTFSFANVTAGNNLNIFRGNSNSDGEYFKGRVSSLYIYNRVLSSAEISTNYNMLKGRYSL